MKQFMQIFKFEFFTYIKDKVFVILTLLFVAILGVTLNFPRISALFSSDEKAEKSVMYVKDLTDSALMERFAAALPNVRFEATELSEEELKTAVDTEENTSAMVIEAPLRYKYIVKNIEMYDRKQQVLNEVMQSRYREDYILKLGASPQEVEQLMTSSVEAELIKTNSGKNQVENYFYTYIMIMALYMAIILYGQLVATSVATEKSSRAMELLITSASPKNLMFGKILGTGLVGILQFVTIIGSGFLFYNFNKELYTDNAIIQSIFNMPKEILLYAFIFFILGFFIYSFMYGALGSLVSRIEQMSTSVLPVTFLFIISFFVVITSMSSGNVNSTVIKICSYIPFTSSMAMFVRICMGNVAFWEILVSILILIVSAIGIGYLAAGIYRMGVLMYGQPPKIKEVFVMLKSAKDNR